MDSGTTAHQRDGARQGRLSSIYYRYWLPAFSYAALAGTCVWGIIPSHILWIVGHVLGEHWYSIYNCMLAAAATSIFLTAHAKKNPALSWRVWDLTICCALISLCGKLIPLRRPSGGMHGFPSGHALTAFAAACLLMNTFPKVAPYAFAIAVGVGWSRVEIHEHFVYQVLVGAILGIAVGAAVSHAEDNQGVILPRILGRRNPNAPQSNAALPETTPPVSLIR